MEHIILALDWTPNINHIGFFIAQDLGFYQEMGLEVTIQDPSHDDYKHTPAKKVELGLADFALCPTESILSYRTKSKPFPLLAVAAILQEDLSAIVVKKSSAINSPKHLDGKSYASYKARYEDAIVRQMIKNDGGDGDISIHYPEKLGIWETLMKDKFDSTWVFLNWELVQATKENTELTTFKMEDYGIPYSYSPVIACDENMLVGKKEVYEKFLKATKRGYLYAVKNGVESVEILSNYVSPHDKNIPLIKALEVSKKAFGSESNWGNIELKSITDFLDWVYEKELETTRVLPNQVFTNSLLD